MSIKTGDRLTLNFQGQQVGARVVSIEEVDGGSFAPPDQAKQRSRKIVVSLDNNPAEQYEELLPLDDEGWAMYKIDDLVIALNHKLSHSGKMRSAGQ